jgi:peptide/nickel transport system substrate-binding protein
MLCWTPTTGLWRPKNTNGTRINALKRQSVWQSAVVAAGLILSAPASAVAQQASQPSLGTVTIATHLDVDTLDPTQNINTHQRWVYRHLFEPLITHDTEGKVKPVLAERWERVADDRWRFFLRKDVKFSNGEPFTAEAVKFTVELMQKASSQASSYYNEFSRVDIVDEHTVDLVTKGPYSGTLTLITDYLNPVPPKYYQEVGPQGFSAKPIGTGAYKLESWTRGTRVVLAPHESWSFGTPKASKVVFWVIPEPSTRVAAVLNGEADVAATIPPIQVERIKQSSNARMEASATSVQPIWGGILVDRPGLTDKRVRQAINYAVNKDAIVQRLLLGYGRVMGQPCPQDTSCWSPDIKAYPYDPEKAKALLKEAGVESLKIKLHFPTGVVPQGNLLAQVVATDLGKVGIQAEVLQEEWSVFASKLFDFKSKQANLGDLFLMYYKAGPTLERVVATILVSDRNWNWEHYNNPTVDKLIRAAETALNDDEKSKSLREMAAIVHEDAPWLFLYEPFSLWGVSNRISWKARNDDYIYVEEMSLRRN